MNINVKKKVTVSIHCTLDSSEAIMFGQGGKHTVALDPEILDDLDSSNTEILISFQMERNSQGTFNFIVGQANNHRDIYDNEIKDSRSP
jgi:predicted HAD superfamily hydrolase